MLPNFIGLGVQRAATTWLHHCLSEHPNVFVPEAKELFYFSTRYEMGQEWYESHFKPTPDQTAVGEITPSYLQHPGAAQRMAELVPDARLFVVLREPVSRAYSAYQLFKDKRYADASFAQACTPESDLVHHSLYASALSGFYRCFPRENVRVYLYEQVEQDRDNTLRDLYRHLGVDESFKPSVADKRVNAAVFPRTQGALRSAGLGWSINMLRDTPIGEWIKRRVVPTSAQAVSRDPIPIEEAQRVRATFHDDVMKLQDLLDRDLSHWLAA